MEVVMSRVMGVTEIILMQQDETLSVSILPARFLALVAWTECLSSIGGRALLQTDFES